MGRCVSVSDCGPLDAFASGFREWLARQGYTPVSVRHRMVQFRQLSRWLRAEGLTAGELDEMCAARFIAARRAQGRATWVSQAGTELPLIYLRGIGAAPDKDASWHMQDTVEWLVNSYRGYLVVERALAATTIRAYVRIARRFCGEMHQQRGALANLRAAEVTAFVVAVCERSSTAEAKKTVTALGSLLRYLHVVGVTECALEGALPKVAGYRRRLARELDTGEVARLLSSCDRRCDAGCRDYAVMKLLCRLGLRAGEVAALTVDDIDWRRGEILIRGKGNRQELLPLPVDVGEALASYLYHGRHRVPPGCRAVFVRVIAPQGPLTSNGVGDVVQRAARRTGRAPIGPHLLRHAAATGMLRHGAGLPAVAQVLRHRGTQVTAVYATVAPEAVRELARPWPGGAR